MATYTTPYRSFSITSPFNSTLDVNTAGSTGMTFDFSGLPAGASISSARVYYSQNLSGGSVKSLTPANGSTISAPTGGTRTYTFSFTATPQYRNVTITLTSVRIVVEYTIGGGGGSYDPGGASAPGTPTLSANNVAPGASVQLTWPSTSWGYCVWYGDGDASCPHWYDPVVHGTNTLPVKAGSTNNGIRYFAVSAKDINSNIGPKSAAVGLKTVWTNPSAPGTPTLSATTARPGTAVTLSWPAASGGTNNPVTGYIVERSVNGGAYEVLTTTTGRSITVYAHGTHGANMRFRAKATGSWSNSAYSAVVQLNSVSPTSTGTLNKSTVPMDDASTIRLTVAAQVSAFKHKAVWYLGARSVTQDLAAGVKTATLTVPKIWCDRLPSAVSGTASVRLETYDGATKIGEHVYTFGVTVPADVVPTLPTFTAALVKNNAPADIGRYIQNYSSVALAISGEAGAYGSTIAKYRLYGHGYDAATKTATFGKLAGTGEHTFTAVVTDSRSRTASKTVKITVQAYKAPSLSGVEMYRCDVNGVKNSAGTYVRLKATSVFSSIDGQNTATLQGRVYMKGATPSAWQGMTSSVMLVAGGGSLLPVKTYIAEIRIVDKLNTYQIDATIPTETVAFHALDGGLGAAVGKYAERVGAFDIPDDWTTNLWRHTNPNILHNWDFTNPINQRGLTTASGGGYWLDRWTLANFVGATYTYSTAWGLRGLTTTNNIIMRQYIENPNAYAGKTVTVSVEIYSASVTASCTIRLWHNGTTAIGSVGIVDGDTGIKSFTATIPSTALTDLSVVFYNYGGNDVRIKRIKLELGTVSTLHLDPPMDHAVELPKCQRFFNIKDLNMAQAITSTRVNGTSWGVNMRTIPTCTLYPGVTSPDLSYPNAIEPHGGGTTISVLSLGYQSPNGFAFVNVDGGITIGAWYRYIVYASSDL